MSRRRGALVVALVGVALAGACSNGTATGPARRGATATSSRSTSTGKGSTATTPDACAASPTTVGGGPGQSVYVANARVATALAWAPDGRLFFAERSGAIKIATPGGVTTFATVPTVTTEANGGYSERGLLGLALSPSFATDHYVYAFYSRQDYQTQVLVRFTDCAGTASAPTVLVTFPAGDDCCHKGGRVEFGRDGKLYVTLGEEHAVERSTVNEPSSIPQDPTDVRGKILRYNPDGTIPTDNPFGATSPVWATGFRNPFGLAFGPDGTAFVTVNGPTGDVGSPSTGYDLAFRVVAGGRYQWPACYGYGHPVSSSGASGPACLGRPDPEWSSESETVVPTGATWVDSSGPAGEAGHFVFCSYTGGMRVFTPGSPHAGVVAGSPAGTSACRYDVVQGPDHALYFSDDTTIYRLG